MGPDTTEQFLTFCCKALGTKPDSPLFMPGDKGGLITAAMVSALLDVFKAANSVEDAAMQRFDDPIWSEPNVCYVIRNQVTGATYVGKSKHGFIKRYPPEGKWYEKHHNKRLMQDVVIYGVRSFRVMLYTCSDKTEMDRVESTIIRTNRLFMYNIQEEPDVG